MKIINKVLALTIVVGASQAQQPSTEIVNGFKKLAPTAKIQSSVETPINGLKQITLNSGNVNDTYYMTDDGKYLINGSIIDTNTNINLTENNKNSMRKEIVSKFSKNQRLDFFPKNGMKYHISVFTDIDCGYCRKLHNEMKEYNNLGIGISYLFWPRAGLQSSSYNKAVTVWCSNNQNQAMNDSQNGLSLEPKQCDNPVKEHYLSGRKIGVRGTPNIVTDKGELIPTYMSPDDLLKQLKLFAAK